MEKIIKKSQFVCPVTTLPVVDPEEQKYTAWQTLRDSGMSCQKIGEMFNVAPNTIWRHTKTNVRIHSMAGTQTNYEQSLQRRAYYVPLMLELRRLGYSNADIAKKTGFCLETVLKYVGKQPDEITLASRRTAGAKCHNRNLAAKNQPERDAGNPIPAVAEIIKTEVA